MFLNLGELNKSEKNEFSVFLKSKYKFFVCVIVFLSSFAFSFDVSVQANVDNAQVFVGDMFNYKIQVTAPENAIVDLPSFVGNLGNFEVKEMKNEKVLDGAPKGSAFFTWNAVLNTFVSGDFLIAPQEVNVIANGDTVNTKTDPVAVKVATRTTGDESDILDVENPFDDSRLPQWFYIFLIIVGVVLLILIGWLLHQKFSRKKEALQLPPYEEAVLALKGLRKKNYLAEGNQGDFFMGLGFIVRRYVERRFNEDILDATVQELKQRMNHVVGLPQAFKESMITLAEETEPVKFAKMKLDGERCAFWDEWADRLLEDTKPTIEEQKMNKTMR